MIRIRWRAAATAPSNTQRMVSKSSSGPSGMPRHSTGPAAAAAGKNGGPKRSSPVVKSQSSANADCRCPTTGPSTRTCKSMLGGARSSRGAKVSRMFMPPVNPIRPSTTSIFR